MSGQLSNCVTLTATEGDYNTGRQLLTSRRQSVWRGGRRRQRLGVDEQLVRGLPYAASDGREDLPARDLLILRGGSWFHYESYVRCAERLSYNPNFSDDDLGFRVVASAVL